MSYIKNLNINEWHLNFCHFIVSKILIKLCEAIVSEYYFLMYLRASSFVLYFTRKQKIDGLIII